MTRDDVERITSQLIKRLTIELEPIDKIDPNQRTILLKYDGDIIDSVTFDIVQTNGYGYDKINDKI